MSISSLSSLTQTTEHPNPQEDPPIFSSQDTNEDTLLNKMPVVPLYSSTYVYIARLEGTQILEKLNLEL